MTFPMKTATAGSIAGVIVAVYFMFSEMEPTTLRLILWPGGVLGAEYEGSEKVLEFLIGTLELAVNFFLYGIVGWLLGKVIELCTGKTRR